MKIMFLADVESASLWDYFRKDKFEGIDLIISCGDLKPSYLSFLATMTGLDVLYVHGNHDDKYEKTPPEGCINIEDKVIVYDGVKIAGLGGSIRYKPGEHQYTEKEMGKRVKKLKHSIKRKKGIDILVTHAPAKGMNDTDDNCHEGFSSFYTILDTHKPKYFVHGHVHLNYGQNIPRICEYNETTVVNAYEKYVVEI